MKKKRKAGLLLAAALGMAFVTQAQKKYVSYLDSEYHEVKNAANATYVQIEQPVRDKLWCKKVYTLPDSILMMESGFVAGYGGSRAFGPLKMYWPNGMLRQEANYYEGNYDGTTKEYYETGQLKSEESFIEGRRWGASSFYLDDGRQIGYAEYLCNKKWGLEVLYSGEGVPEDSLEYNAGSLLDRKTYHNLLEGLGIRRYRSANKYWLEYVLADGRRLRMGEGDMNAAGAINRGTLSGARRAETTDAAIRFMRHSQYNDVATLKRMYEKDCLTFSDTSVFLLKEGDTLFAHVRNPWPNYDKEFITFEKGKWLGCDAWYRWASYPAGEEAMRTLYRVKTKFNEDLVPDNVAGDVTVALVINEEGKPEQLKLIKSLYPELDEAVMRVTQSVTDWKPALIQGKPIRSLLFVSVRFNEDGTIY
jgi:hypothetical protein